MAPSNETANAIPQSSRFRQIIAGQVLNKQSDVSDTLQGQTPVMNRFCGKQNHLSIWCHDDDALFDGSTLRVSMMRVRWDVKITALCGRVWAQTWDDLIGKYEWYIKRDNGWKKNKLDRNKLISNWKHDRLAVKRQGERSCITLTATDRTSGSGCYLSSGENGFLALQTFHYKLLTGEGKHVPTTSFRIA